MRTEQQFSRWCPAVALLAVMATTIQGQPINKGPETTTPTQVTAPAPATEPAKAEVKDTEKTAKEGKDEAGPKPDSGDKAAKDLYYEAAGAPSGHGTSVQASIPHRIGLRYKITLKDSDGDVRDVTERFRFSTGDRIRLAFESNMDGYLYIYHQGSSSRGVQLFPDPRINDGKNLIRRHTEVSIPPRKGEDRGWFKFDPKTGKEELLVFLSPKPIGDLSGVSGGEGSELDEGAWRKVTALGSKSDDPKSRDLYFDSEQSSGNQGDNEPSTAYIVSRNPMLMHRIVLKHGN